MNICCIGSGSIARMHAAVLAAAGHTLWSVVGRRPDQTAAFARETGFRTSETDVDAALADPALEAVVIGSPSGLHVEHASKALARGLPVLLEIPVALNVRQALALDQQARAAGVTLMAAHTRRFQPAMRAMRELVQSGRLTLHHVIQRYGFLRRENVNWVGYRRSWTDNLIWHHGGHAVDALMWVAGATDAHVAVQIGPPGRTLGIPMDIAIGLKTPSGLIGNVALSYNTQQPLDDALFIGEEDTVLADYAHGVLRGKDGVIFDAKMDAVVPTDVIAAQDAEFIAAVREGRPPQPGIGEVLPSLRVLQAAQDAYDLEYGAPLAPAPSPPGSRRA